MLKIYRTVKKNIKALFFKSIRNIIIMCSVQQKGMLLLLAYNQQAKPMHGIHVLLTNIVWMIHFSK